MQQIEDILFREARGVLSLVGGGGKTSLMFHLARLLGDAGRTVLATTTTKIMPPGAEQSATLLVEADPQALLSRAAASLRLSRQVTAVRAFLPDTGKLAGFTPEAIETFASSRLFDWILVEADGSARLPLKAPADHEPVIPANSTVCLAVAGLEVLGRPFGGEIVFRPELAGPIMGLVEGECITEASLVRLFSHPRGSFKGAPEGARRLIFLNKADDRERQAGGARVAELLGRIRPAVAEAVLVGQALAGIRLHALLRLGEGA